jgi:hypothetical protein
MTFVETILSKTGVQLSSDVIYTKLKFTRNRTNIGIRAHYYENNKAYITEN